jgi:hypothetical protein
MRQEDERDPWRDGGAAVTLGTTLATVDLRGEGDVEDVFGAEVGGLSRMDRARAMVMAAEGAS